MSGFRNDHRRPGGIRWFDEETTTDRTSFSRPFTRQIPPPLILQPSNLTDLNNELQADEQRHFDVWEDEWPETSSNNLSSAGVWNYRDSDRMPPPYEPRRSQPDEVLDTISAFSPQDLFPEAGPSHVEPRQGYMDQPSHFSLDAPPTESTFLDSYPKGNATLTYQNDDNTLESIHNVNVTIIQERCPILGIAFESSRSGPQLYLETLTPTTALPFLRFLYTGTYALKSPTGETEDLYEDVPTSVFFHCQLYRLADIYDLPDLKSQAYVNVLRQCEFGCSSPDKPIDLCAAIRFIYQYLREHENLVDAIINYCVSCFLGHHLAQDKEFKKLAYELRPFHQDLCKNSMNREFENETAIAIVQMPFKPYIPETYASREDPATKNFDDVYHFHAGDEIESSVKKRKRPERLAKDDDTIKLPLRLHEEQTDPPIKEQVIEDEDYKFGSKRRASSVTCPSQPRHSDLSQLLAGPDQGALSETEYEIVDGPPAVDEATDSDSDSSTLVEVKHEELNTSCTLPIRSREPPAATAAANAAESDSDSEWTLV